MDKQVVGLLGDIGKSIVLIMNVGFIYLSVKNPDIFSSFYIKNGFCTDSETHLNCFYANSITSFLLFFLIKNNNIPATKPIRKNSLSLLGHGFGHLFISQYSEIINGKVFEILNIYQTILSIIVFNLFGMDLHVIYI
jgi:hypothetical protein